METLLHLAKLNSRSKMEKEIIIPKRYLIIPKFGTSEHLKRKRRMYYVNRDFTYVMLGSGASRGIPRNQKKLL